MRRVKGRHQRSDVDGQDGDDDAGQKDGGQLVDILHSDEDEQTHEQEADGAVDTHVVQHGCPFAVWAFGGKDGRFGSHVHLGKQSL